MASRRAADVRSAKASAERRGEEGVALVMAMFAVLVLSAVGAGLMLSATIETMIASHFKTSRELRYATESLLDRSVRELGATADWSPVAAGIAHSTFVDGVPGVRVLPDGSALDLEHLDAVEPGWRLFAYGPLGALLPGSGASPGYLLVLGSGVKAGEGRLILEARGFGPRGARQVVQAVVAQVDRPPGVRVLSWRVSP